MKSGVLKQPGPATADLLTAETNQSGITPGGSGAAQNRNAQGIAKHAQGRQERFHLPLGQMHQSFENQDSGCQGLSRRQPTPHQTRKVPSQAVHQQGQHPGAALTEAHQGKSH